MFTWDNDADTPRSTAATPRAWSSIPDKRSGLLAQQLDLGEQLLGSWVKKERIRRTSTDTGQPSPEETAAEIARLRKEVADLKAENELP